MKRLLILLLLALSLTLPALADVPAQVQAPDHLTLDPIVTNTGYTTIVIDAEIDVPQVEAMNVYPIIPLTLTPDVVYALCQELDMDTLCGSKKDGTPIPIGEIRSVEDIEFVKDDYITAYGPDDASAKIHVRGDVHEAYVINNTWRGVPYGCRIQLQLRKPRFEYFPSIDPFLPDEAMEDCAYSRAEAEEMATRLVACIDPSLTLEYKGIVTGSTWVTGMTAAEIDAEWERNKDIVVPISYGFLFSRVVDGVRVPPSQHQGVGGPEEHQMRPVFQNERLTVVVSDQGIDRLDYYDGYDIGEPIQTAVALLPFDQIVSVVTAILPIKLMAEETTYHLPSESVYTIHRISLNYMRVLKANNPEEFELIPVWDFWGSYQSRYPHKNGTWSEWKSHGGDTYSCITVNAMTGLVVDREYAY